MVPGLRLYLWYPDCKENLAVSDDLHLSLAQLYGHGSCFSYLISKLQIKVAVESDTDYPHCESYLVFVLMLHLFLCIT